MVTGNEYRGCSIEKEEMLRQIVEVPALPFIRRGVPAWPELEQVLAKALAKRPAERFATVTEFASAVAAISQTEDAAAVEEVVTPAVFPEAQQMLRSILARMDVGGSLFVAGLEAAPRVSVT